jgi:histidinol-phosphate aminotransferase
LVILRTLSKSYALAGMRMGCMLCGDADLAQLIRAKGLDAYPLPHASINAALHVMTPEIQAIARANIATLLAERSRMEEALKASDAVVHVYPSDTNFLLVKMHRPQDFLHACAAQNIIIRDFSTKDGTKDCIRLSIGTPEQNDQVLGILKRF